MNNSLQAYSTGMRIVTVFCDFKIANVEGYKGIGNIVGRTCRGSSRGRRRRVGKQSSAGHALKGHFLRLRHLATGQISRLHSIR